MRPQGCVTATAPTPDFILDNRFNRCLASRGPRPVEPSLPQHPHARETGQGGRHRRRHGSLDFSLSDAELADVEIHEQAGAASAVLSDLVAITAARRPAPDRRVRSNPRSGHARRSAGRLRFALRPRDIRYRADAWLIRINEGDQRRRGWLRLGTPPPFASGAKAMGCKGHPSHAAVTVSERRRRPAPGTLRIAYVTLPAEP